MDIAYRTQPVEGMDTVIIQNGADPLADTGAEGKERVSFDPSAAGNAYELRNYFARLGKGRTKACQILFELPDASGRQIRQLAELVVEALYEGAYRFRKECLKEWDAESVYRSRERLADYGTGSFVLVSSENLEAVAAAASMRARCVGYARSLGNLPFNYFGIADMLRYAQELAQSCSLRCTVLDQKQLSELGCGGILAVNRGSDRGAAMLVLEYCNAPEKKKTALIGKGILFDSGGYHLKSIDGMDGMKFDMCGAANMLELMEMAALDGGKQNLIAVLPLAENLIGPEATKLGDVVMTMAGKSVEVYNTDAEGRLILCDALTYAQKQGAVRLVDLATLTYSCQSALGDQMVGIFSNSNRMFADFARAMERKGQLGWRLPLHGIYQQLLCWSDVADFANYAPGKGAGASVAAGFLEFFVEPGVEWLHLDVVGPAVQRQEAPERCKGATGVCMLPVWSWLFEG